MRVCITAFLFKALLSLYEYIVLSFVHNFMIMQQSGKGENMQADVVRFMRREHVVISREMYEYEISSTKNGT